MCPRKKKHKPRYRERITLYGADRPVLKTGIGALGKATGLLSVQKYGIWGQAVHPETARILREQQYLRPGIPPHAVGRVGKPPSHGVVDRKKKLQTTDVVSSFFCLSTTEWRLIHAVHSIYQKQILKHLYEGTDLLKMSRCFEKFFYEYISNI